MKKAKAVPRTPVHRNTKRTGEMSEAAFMLKASMLGSLVAKPWGDSELYDFILDNGDRMWRVQLKCTEVVRARGYDVQFIHVVPGKGKVAYTAQEIDVLVAHIVPADAWYILPIEVCGGAKSFRFYPDIPFKNARWEKYREAWHLLGLAPQSTQPRTPRPGKPRQRKRAVQA